MELFRTKEAIFFTDQIIIAQKNKDDIHICIGDIEYMIYTKSSLFNAVFDAENYGCLKIELNKKIVKRKEFSVKVSPDDLKKLSEPYWKQIIGF